MPDGYLRPILFGSIDKFLMRAGISMHRLYLEKVAAGSLTDDCGHIFGIALQFAVRYQPAGTGRGIHAIGFRNGEVSHKNFFRRSEKPLSLFAVGCGCFGYIRTLIGGKGAKDNNAQSYCQCSADKNIFFS